MQAVDTNVLVRFLTRDNETQAREARQLFFNGPVWIAKTVLLETDWVLRSLYTYDRDTIRTAFARLVSMPMVTSEDEDSVLAALSLMDHGISFADAIHVSSRPAEAMFLTFDRDLVKRAKRAGVPGVSEIPAGRE